MHFTAYTYARTTSIYERSREYGVEYKRLKSRMSQNIQNKITFNEKCKQPLEILFEVLVKKAKKEKKRINSFGLVRRRRCCRRFFLILAHILKIIIINNYLLPVSALHSLK